MAQRRADVFMSMLETWAEDADAATAPRTRGLASLVVALSAKDLTTLPTDTGSAPGSINAGADAACATATNTGSAASANDADTGSPLPVSGESLNAPSVWFPPTPTPGYIRSIFSGWVWLNMTSGWYSIRIPDAPSLQRG